MCINNLSCITEIRNAFIYPDDNICLWLRLKSLIQKLEYYSMLVITWFKSAVKLNIAKCHLVLSGYEH